MSAYLLKNGKVLHPDQGTLVQAQDVLVVNKKITHIVPTGTKLDLPSNTQVLDINGQVIMPGLIDCHVHVVATSVNLGLNGKLPSNLIMIKTLPILKSMLMRGFTTVRDGGGADWAIAHAIDEYLIPGPRIFYCGHALSQTGGHGDYRFHGESLVQNTCSGCLRTGALARIVDGVDNVRRAAREEVQAGAKQLKIMAAGGVSSPTDPVDNVQYSKDEIHAVIEEAEAVGTYVMAHAYSARSIKRLVEFGVRSIEHGNLIDVDTAKFMQKKGAVVVPTQITYEMLALYGEKFGLLPESVAKIEHVRLAGRAALKICAEEGVLMAFGSDLLGEMHSFQAQGLGIIAEELGNLEAIRQATTFAAVVLNKQGELGCIKVGALADILVVAQNPLESITCLTNELGEDILFIMQDGRVIKNNL